MEKIHEFKAHESYVIDMLFTRNSQRLVSAGMDNAIHLWSVPDWEHIAEFQGHDHSANSIALSLDEKVLASGSSDKTVKLWSFPQGDLIITLQDRKKVVSTVAISPDGEWVAAGSYGGRVAIWTRTGVPVTGFNASKKNLSSIAFSPDGKKLVTSGLGDDIFIWTLPEGSSLGTLSGHQTAVWGLTFIKQGQQLVSIGYEGSVKVWDPVTLEALQTYQLKSPNVRGLLISPDEQVVALSMESKVQLWNLEHWSLAFELPISTKVVSSMAFSPDGRWFAAGGADRTIRIWER